MYFLQFFIKLSRGAKIGHAFTTTTGPNVGLPVYVDSGIEKYCSGCSCSAETVGWLLSSQVSGIRSVDACISAESVSSSSMSLASTSAYCVPSPMCSHVTHPQRHYLLQDSNSFCTQTGLHATCHEQSSLSDIWLPVISHK